MHFWLISNQFIHNTIVLLLLPKYSVERTRLKTNLAFGVSCSERERERNKNSGEVHVCVLEVQMTIRDDYALVRKFLYERLIFPFL